MPLIIESPKLKRFANLEGVRVGPRIRAAVRMVVATGKTGKAVAPPEGKVTHAGELRGHHFSDAAKMGFIDQKVKPKTGQILYFPNRYSAQVAKAPVLKAPPKGYRKVLRGRPPLKTKRAA